MAKDTRGNARSSGQVDLAKKAAGAAKSGTKKASGKKKKRTAGRTIIMVLLIVLIAISLVFVGVLGVMIFQSMSTPKANNSSIALNSYVTTPQGQQDKVAYYLVGLMGAESTDDTAMLSVVCHDKQAGTMQILQVPAATYLGESDSWAVKTAGGVWGDPKPLDWCETCRQQVFAPEIRDGRHNVEGCNTKITQKTGSATENLIQVFNEQYSLPIDNFYMLPQEALVKLVNLVGGIDVALEADMQVDKISYKKGVQTLDGDAALHYATAFNYKSTPDSDVERLVRQRKVYTALLQRLTETDATELTEEVIGPLMNGSTPIRTNSNTKDMVALLGKLADIDAANIAYYMMPGESARSGKETYYSIHRADLVSLLNDSFNPYGQAITEGNLLLTELDNSKETDLKKQLASEILVEQSGTMATTAAPQ